MPTINSYENKSGYYIRARPSGAGNITYKIKTRGNSIVWQYGLRDGDEIAWSTIQSFKALGIIYTEQSGPIGPDEFEPDPEQLAKTELTESEANELFSIITSQFDLSSEERTEIRSILGLSAELNLEKIGERIESYLKSHIDREGISVRTDQTVEDADDLEILTWVDDVDSDHDGCRNLHVLFRSERSGESRFTDHCIHLCHEHGLEGWHIRGVEEPSWEIKQVAIEQKGVILPYLLDELRETEFDLGDPSEVLAPLVGYV